MSAKFIWVRNPTAINGLATTYVSLRGSDTTGNGTAQNPYRSLAKATTMAAASTNIMIDDGIWSEGISKKCYLFGNAKTILKNVPADSYDASYYYLILDKVQKNRYRTCYIYNCIGSIGAGVNSSAGATAFGLIAHNSIILGEYIFSYPSYYSTFYNCIYAGSTQSYATGLFYNCVFITKPNVNVGSLNNNFTTNPIIGNNSINNESTGQTIADYFTYVHPNVLANPATASIDDWLACDFTAKPGSANIGAGTNGGNIGFNQGYPARATNDSNDIFAAANGATLRNVAWNATLNGYSLVHKDKVCAGYTVNTITLAADAEATDDYYNGLFIGITAGDGAGEIHRIVDYDGATRVATIDTSWQSAISTSSIYSISGTIDSATKDFGKVIKVKRNWAFLANMQSWTDPNDSSYGMWKEFLTSPLQNNGEWMMRPCGNFRYEYSINGTEWHSSSELLAGTDSDNKTYNAAYGNASESYVAASASTTVLRYIRYHIEIGFNIGEDAQ